MATTERRKGMTETIEAINALKEEFHIFIAQHKSEYANLASSDEILSKKLDGIDITIRGNGKKGLVERVSGLELSQKIIIGVLVLIGTGLLGFIVDNILGHVFP